MFLRVFSFVVISFLCFSCDKISFTKKTSSATVIDTIVDFSSVDVSPSFKTCDSIIEKSAKTACFRTTIHKKISEKLLENTFSVKDSISEILRVHLSINSKGIIVLEKIEATENCKMQLPTLDSLLKVSVAQLPVIYPAIKRGIPVTTKYQLPISIQLKELVFECKK